MNIYNKVVYCFEFLEKLIYINIDLYNTEHNVQKPNFGCKTDFNGVDKCATSWT